MERSNRFRGGWGLGAGDRKYVSFEQLEIGGPMRTKRILLVDDDPDILEIVRYGLELEGYEVVTAANGLERVSEP